jgi:hypothetical protein
MEDLMAMDLAYWRHEEERLIRELKSRRWDRKRVHGKCVEFSEVIMAFSHHHSHGDHLNGYELITPPYIITRLYLQGRGFLTSPRSANVFQRRDGWDCVLITRSGHQSYYRREAFGSWEEALRRARDFINELGIKGK